MNSVRSSPAIPRLHASRHRLEPLDQSQGVPAAILTAASDCGVTNLRSLEYNSGPWLRFVSD